MKKTTYLIAVMLIVAIAGCKKTSFLDKQVEITTEEQVFADSAKAVQLLTDCYAFTGQDVMHYRVNYINSGAGNDYACLEELTTMSVSGFGDPQSSFMSGSSTPANHPFVNYWTVYYKKIRTLNLFLLNIDKTPMNATAKSRLKAEARFLRAFYYTALVRIYGSVQLMGNTVLGISDAIISKRNTYKECVDYIVAECDTVAAITALPNALDQPADQYGRVTRGMAQALKARILLTAASPMFNGSAITTDATLLPLVSYSANYDAGLWQKAADAFYAVIQSNQYSLVTDNTTQPGWGFRQQFLTRHNTENIFPFMRPANNELEVNRFPYSRTTRPLGTIVSNPAENIVMAFGMNNGKSISDNTSGYNPANPYVNRDPRFYYSIIYNQATIWRSGFSTPQPVNIYTGGEDAVAQYNTRTGYFSRKMCDDLVPTTTNKDRVYPVIRYAEILLGYAEALNELGRTEEAVTYINKIRTRAGIAPGADNRYGIAAGITKDQLRRIIQNEYKVEFFQEGHWYYDSRRWKVAEVEENLPIQGMRVTRSGTSPNYTYTYAPFTVISSYFIKPKMYLAPIPQNEINKSAELIQNPGW